MIFLDFLVLSCVLYGLIKGFHNGLIKELASFFVFFIASYISLKLNTDVAVFLEGLIGNKKITPTLSFLGLFLIVVFFVTMLSKILEKISNAFSLSLLNRFFGSLFGMLKIIIFLGFLFSFLFEYQIISKKTQEKSQLVSIIQHKSKPIIAEIQKQKQWFLKKIKNR